MQKTADQAGFTLLEVMVALAVLAIALAALVSAGGRAVFSAAQLEERVFANWVAANRLQALRMQPQWPDLGSERGKESMGERDWEWHQLITKTAQARVRKVVISVYGAQGEAVSRQMGYVVQNGRGG